jgi:heat shock protein HslJ
MTRLDSAPTPRRRRAWFAAAGLVAIAIVVGACSSSSSPSPSGSSLTGTPWQLTAITEKVPAFQGVVPAESQPNYTITFATDGTYSGKADCNNMNGAYTTTSSGGITITPGAMTLMACPEGSMADQYLAGLAAATTYVVDGDQLTLTLKDEGTLEFATAK